MLYSFLFISIMAAILLRTYMLRKKKLAKIRFISTYKFPESAKFILSKKHPDWDDKTHSYAWNGLREFFVCTVFSKKQLKSNEPLVMPSVIVNEAWVAFTEACVEYDLFYKTLFGNFIPYAPSYSSHGSLMTVEHHNTLNKFKEMYRNKIFASFICAGRRVDNIRSSRLLIPTILPFSPPFLFTLDQAFSSRINKNI
jgi:hypothetical protein